jgi:CrcB protein
MNAWENCMLVAAGGFVGAIVRFWVGQFAGKRLSSIVPYGTLFINLTGSFLLGLLYGANVSHELVLLLGTGFMGAYTTFSTFTYESVQLGLQRRWATFLFYLGVSTTAGILLAYLGLLLGRAIV